MLESPQLLLIIIIIVLTVLLLVLGVQAFLILKEFRQTVHKANNLMDEVKSGTNVAKIAGTVIALFLDNKFGKNFMDLFVGTKDKKSTKSEKIQSQPEKIEIIEEVKKPKKLARRFFKRRPR